MYPFSAYDIDDSIKFIVRASLDLNLRHINLDKKNNHDLLSRKNREKDRDTRNLKKVYKTSHTRIYTIYLNIIIS